VWAAEQNFSSVMSVYDHVYENSIPTDIFGYTLNRSGFDFGMMFLIGCFWRLLSFLAMIGLNRDKQR
jgi:hypothetical protein